MKIKNPVLRGFHPDPSVIRVGEDYYVANSTFEWWPGVRIHHSRDLISWNLIGYPLNRRPQLDLYGVGASQGIWAPDLSYCDGVFYLVYTVVKSFYCNMSDTHNYLVTAETIHGPWSEPIALTNYGFDPSLFHDTDGRKYLVSMVTDHRVPQKYAGRLILQEFDVKTGNMTGDTVEIFRAASFYLEGPHLYKHGEYYYLMSADTGTEEKHGESILRSKHIVGPYEHSIPEDNLRIRTQENEAYSFMTSRHDPDHPIQKCGHGALVDTPEGNWYMMYLCGRPSGKCNSASSKKLPGARRYMLGRETAITPVEWTEDGWLQLVTNEHATLPDVEVEVKVSDKKDSGWSKKHTAGQESELILNGCLNPEFQTLRIPLCDEVCNLADRPEYLRLYGQEGLSSKFNQSLLARRLTEYHVQVTTEMEFEPSNYKQMAGLILLYDTDNYLYLHITFDEELGKCITILRVENNANTYPAGFLPIAGKETLRLRLNLEGTQLQFSYSLGNNNFMDIGAALDASFISDEACKEGWFTGAMVGICCQDLTGLRAAADFKKFCYYPALPY